MAKYRRRGPRRPEQAQYRQMVADLAASTNGEHKRELSKDIVAMVHRAYVRDQPWAADVISRWEREGAERDYERAHTALYTTIVIRNGKRMKKTTSYSLPRRDEESGDVIHIQASFWDYERPEYVSKLNELMAQGARIDDVVAAMKLVLKSMDAHPGLTARAAWEADGYSVDQIVLDRGEEVA